MKKYWFVFAIHWQENLQQRFTFFMDRFRSLVTLISFYFVWSSLLAQNSSFAGYDRGQMITYLLGMNILRSLVFASRMDEIAGDINHERLSPYLLKPIHFIAYALFRDLSVKSINLASALIEVTALVLFFGALRWPHQAVTWALFLLAVIGAIALNFFLSFIVGCWGFWTAESGGPRFCLELFLEFTAGAFFPLDVLPASWQTLFKSFPSPYLVFFPLQIFLERMEPQQILSGFFMQVFWIAALGLLARTVWQRGLSRYGGAEGT